MAHDVHDFLKAAQVVFKDEYERIQKRAKEDPGTAGDQGEENWATLLRQWLPQYFRVVTKGRIITASGYVSPQVDVLVLSPSYPKILDDKKLYLAGGVAAAFECKLTLEASHVRSAVETAAAIQKNMPERLGTPYQELHTSLRYGVLAHSHSWTGKASKPVDNVNRAINESDSAVVTHPKQCLDFICVADLATWNMVKLTYFSPRFLAIPIELGSDYPPEGFASTSYSCSVSKLESQPDYFTPLGSFLCSLYRKFAWDYSEMRTLATYFETAGMGGRSEANSRKWPATIYSDQIRERVYNGQLSHRVNYDEWQMAFV